MKLKSCDRGIARIFPMPRLILGLAAILGAAPTLHAQQLPGYGAGAYPQAYYQQPAAVPYGYPQGYQQPVAPAQNFYYGNYQNNTVPGYVYPRNYTAPNVPSYYGNGVNYYYVQNPYAWNYTSPPVPSASNLPRTSSWPAAMRAPAMPPAPALMDDPADDGRKPEVKFHRDPHDTAWLKGDYLMIFLRPMRLGSGPLATNGSAFDVAPGAIGQSGTTNLVGDTINYNMKSGMRFEIGAFMDKSNCFSLDLAGFFLIANTTSQTFSSDANGNPTIARPIFNVAAGIEGALLTSLPGQIAGTLNIENRAELSGLEFNARYHSYVRERLHVEGLLGFRYLRLAERMQLHDELHPLTNNFLQFRGGFLDPTMTLMDDDSFRTVNQFFGPQIGTKLTWEYHWLNLETFAKLGLGVTTQQTDIAGSTTLTSPNGTQTAAGGILALPSNIGHHSRTIVGILPEFGVNVGIEVCEHVRFNAGYSLLMWNRVVRPASQFEHNVNPTQIPSSGGFGVLGGPNAPQYRFNDEFFWTHLFSLGLEFRY